MSAVDIYSIDGLTELLRIERIEDYPQIEAVLFPAAESAIAHAVGESWLKANEDDPTVVQLACTMVAAWLDKPEMLGEVTPGALFMLGQLQARAIGG